MLFLIFFAMIGCFKNAGLAGIEKAISRGQLAEYRDRPIWTGGGFGVKLEELYSLVREISNKLSTPITAEEMAILRPEPIVGGEYNFFHLLFSLPLRPKDGYFKGLEAILDQCFPDKKIPKDVAEVQTTYRRANILHLAILTGSAYVAGLIIDNAEEAEVLDRENVGKCTPLLLLTTRYIDASVEKTKGGSRREYRDLLDKMLGKGFNLAYKNSKGYNFLTITLNDLYQSPYDGDVESKSSHKAISGLKNMLRHVRRISLGNEVVRGQLSELYSTYKIGLFDYVSKKLVKDIDWIINDKPSWLCF